MSAPIAWSWGVYGERHEMSEIADALKRCTPGERITVHLSDGSLVIVRPRGRQ